MAAYDRLRRSAFLTELAGTRRLDGRSPERQAQRAAARRGCRVERAVLLVDPARRDEEDVRELVELDRSEGVHTFLIDAANALPPFDGPGHSLRFELWDGEVVCTAPGASAGGEGWRISRRREELERAVFAAEALRNARGPVREGSAGALELVVSEPLATSAPLARTRAPTLCAPQGPGIPDCASYHGLVQYMRLLDLVSSPQRHGQFYRSNLASLAGSGHRRALIAGAADYSMLAHTLAAYEEAGATPEVTVLDRCPTPLMLCRWFAARRSIAIRTMVANVVDLDCAERYDLICTDALLVLLSGDEKPVALSRLAGALRPGGRLVTTIRIAPEAGGGAQRYDEERAAGFAQRAREEANRRAGLLDVDPDVLGREAHAYASGIVVYPVRSPDELVELFQDAGLTLQQLDVLDLPGRTTATQAGPGAHQAAAYAHIVAARE